MREAIGRFWREQVVFWGLLTAGFATAAGIWDNKWLAFAAAFTAAGGAIFSRTQVEATPSTKLPGYTVKHPG